MEEREILEVLYEMFERALPVLKNVREGFEKENGKIVKEQSRKFSEILKSSLPFFEALVQKKEKDQVEKKGVELLLIAQMIGTGIQNLLSKMVLKTEADILFSDKAKREIGELLDEVGSQLRDLKDFILTKNPDLKDKIIERNERIVKMHQEFDLAHERRLITGVCMPKASYIYIDMTDSIRKIAWSIKKLAEKV
jgi:Na+/phosphate symporter